MSELLFYIKKLIKESFLAGMRFKSGIDPVPRLPEVDVKRVDEVIPEHLKMRRGSDSEA